MKQDTCIVIAINGHVWACSSFTMEDGWAHLANVRTIREWGTTQGLNQLVPGPTKNTKLDTKAPMLACPLSAIIGVIPCDNSGWKKHLDA